jgi:hypothetical protein
VDVADSLVMDDAAIATEARSAGGGAIIVRGANLLDMQDSVITSRVRELTGDAGSITLRPSILVADSAVIRASTFAGEAGTVRIGGIRIQSPDSVVDVSSVEGRSAGDGRTRSRPRR